MPKKSKLSPSSYSDLPDLETRRAHLRAIGMPSPYQGESTSSSSLIDSSSSPTANETEESSDNTRESEKAIYEVLTNAHPANETEELSDNTRESGKAIYGALTGTHPANETEESSDSTRESEKAIYEALTSARPANETEGSSDSTRESEKATYEALTSYDQNTSAHPANETEKSSEDTRESEKAIYEASTRAHKNTSAHLADETEESSDSTRESEEATYEALGSYDQNTSAHLANETEESSDSTRESEEAIYEALTSAQIVHEILRKEESAGAANISTDSEAEIDSNISAAITGGQKTLVVAKTHQSVCISGAGNTSTAVTSVYSDKKYQSYNKCQDSKASNLSPAKTELKQISCARQAPKDRETVESSECGYDNEKYPKVTNAEALRPQAKRTSSKEKGKSVTPTKRTTEASPKEKSRTVTPVKHTLEASRNKGEKTETPVKSAQSNPVKEKTKTATPTKGISKTPSRDSREKIVSPVKCRMEVPLKVRAKTATPSKHSSEVPAKEKTKRVTPSKHPSGVPSKGKAISTTPTKYMSDGSSREKVKNTGTPTKCLSEVPPKERTKTVTPVSYKPEVQLKGRAKSMTPTKCKSEVLSNGNRAKSLTPVKYTPNTLSKAAKIEAQTASRTGAREEFGKTQTPTKCTSKASLEANEVRPKTPVKNIGRSPSCEKVTKSILPTKHGEEKPSREIRTKSVTPKKRTKGVDKDFKAKKQCQETPTKHPKECVLEENETPTHVENLKKHDLAQGFEGKNDNTEQKLISFKEFKEALGVDRIQTPDENFDKASDKSSENSVPKRSPEQKQQIRMISTEEFLEALALAVDKLELKRTSSNDCKIGSKVDPPAITEPLIPRITIEEFRSSLGTEKIPPAYNDDLEVFNKALDKLEAKKRRRVTFLIPNEPVPSTSRTRTSPEIQLDKKASQNRGSASNRNETLSCGNLTFEEFHRGLRTFGMIKPELLNFDVFDKALEEMQKNSSSQPTQDVPVDSCRPNPLEETDESDSSDEDINSAIAASGMKMKRSRIVSSDDEPKTTRQSDIRKMPHSSLPKLEESKLCAPEITNRTLDEDFSLSESTSKSSEASPEESSGKSDLVSSESIVKSSGSEISPLESAEVSPDQNAESSESAVKSMESEPSPEEYGEVDKVPVDSNESERHSSRYDIESSVREESMESSEESDLGSLKKRHKKDEHFASIVEKSVSNQHRSRTRSESDLRKRRPGDHDLIPRKKRYSDEH